MRKTLYIILLLVVFAATASAQESNWSFGAMAEGQHNFVPSNTYDFTGLKDYWKNAHSTLGLKSAYKGKKIKSSLTLKGIGDKRNFFTESDDLRGDLLAVEDTLPENLIWKKGYNETRDSTWKYTISFNFDWNIAPADNLSFKYDREAERKVGNTTNSIVELMHDDVVHYGTERLKNKMHYDRFQLLYSHRFKKGSAFKGDVDMRIKKTDNFSSWMVWSPKSDDDYYYTEPIRWDNDFKGNFRYENKKFCGIKDLAALIGFLADNHNDNDNITFFRIDPKTDEWKEDKKQYRHVDYTAIMYGPYVEAGWKFGRFDFKANIQLQMFSRLMSEDGAHHKFNWSEPEMIIDSKIGWRPGKGHTLAYKYKRSATRPSYDQLNPFELPGAKSDEVIKGNTKLKAAIGNLMDFSYSYNYKRFTVTAGADLNLAQHEIEKVVQLDSTTNIKTRTWVNTASSKTFNIKTTLAWNGKKFKADLTYNYKQAQTILSSGRGVPGRTFSVKAKASYLLPWDIKISSDLAYSSPSRKAYSETSHYYTLNARIDKTYKKFKFWVAGLHLLERPITTYTSNEEFTYFYIQSYHYYRRQLQLGVSYNF